MADNNKESLYENLRVALLRRYKTFQKIHYISLLFTTILITLLVHRMYTFVNPPILIILLGIYFLMTVVLNIYGMFRWSYVFRYYEKSEYTHSEEIFKKILFLALFINPILYAGYYHASYNGKYDPLMLNKIMSNFNNSKKIVYTQYLIYLLEKNHNFEEEKLRTFNDKLRNLGFKNPMKYYPINLFKHILGVFVSLVFAGFGYFILIISKEPSDIYLAISASQFLGLIVFSTFSMHISGIVEYRKTLKNESYLVSLIQTKFLLNGLGVGGVLSTISKTINEIYKDIYFAEDVN